VRQKAPLDLYFNKGWGDGICGLSSSRATLLAFKEGPWKAAS
jgi:hypothetical protein